MTTGTHALFFVYTCELGHQHHTYNEDRGLRVCRYCGRYILFTRVEDTADHTDEDVDEADEFELVNDILDHMDDETFLRTQGIPRPR